MSTHEDSVSHLHGEPPSYSDTTKGEDYSEILDTIKSALDENRQSDAIEAESDEAVRLGNFLFYMLTVDYEARIPHLVRLSAKDQEHYLFLANCMIAIPEDAIYSLPTEHERLTLGAFLWKHVHRPSRFLSLPKDLVIHASLRFYRYRDASGRYKGCLQGVAHDNGLRKLGIKLFVDKHIVIRRVAPRVRDAEILLQALDKHQQKYFEQDPGFDGVVEVRPGQGKDGWCNGSYETHKLNKAGQDYQAQREKGLKSVSYVQMVKDCLKGWRHRADKEYVNLCKATPSIPYPFKPRGDDDDRTTPGSVSNPDFWNPDVFKKNVI